MKQECTAVVDPKSLSAVISSVLQHVPVASKALSAEKLVLKPDSNVMLVPLIELKDAQCRML